MQLTAKEYDEMRAARQEVKNARKLVEQAKDTERELAAFYALGIDSEKAEAVKRAEQLEKQLAVSSSAETVKFKFYFDALDGDFKKITESLKKQFEENSETAAKFKNACYGALDIMKKRLDEIGQ